MFNDQSIDRWVVHPSLNAFPRLVSGVRWGETAINLSISANGPRVDFSTVLWFPLVSKRFADAIAQLASSDVEPVAVCIEGDCESFWILHVIWDADCLDRGRSEISPDGMIWKIALNPGMIPARKVFRLAKNYVRIIVSQDVKSLVEQLQFTGVVFAKVES